MKSTLWQFIKDGLVGVAIAFLFFLILTSIIWNGWALFVGDSFDYVSVMFFVSRTYNGDYSLGPMPLISLTAFISVGLGGRFLETIAPEENWRIFVAKILNISFWTALGLSVVYGIFLGIPYIMYFALFGALGVAFAFLVSVLISLIINPQRRLYKIITAAILSTLVGYSVGYVILILILTPRD